MRPLALTTVLLSLAGTAAPQAIQFDQGRKIWLLKTAENSYAMGLDAQSQLQHLYWAGPLWRIDDIPAATVKSDISSFDPHQMIENEEFPGWGGVRYYETALKVTRADGNRDLVLHYASHHIDGDRLDITLKDIRDDIRAVLHYRVYPAAGIIARWSTIENHTPKAITLESAQSATWYAPPGDGYRLSYLSGRWAAETQLNQ